MTQHICTCQSSGSVLSGCSGQASIVCGRCKEIIGCMCKGELPSVCPGCGCSLYAVVVCESEHAQAVPVGMPINDHSCAVCSSTNIKILEIDADV